MYQCLIRLREKVVLLDLVLIRSHDVGLVALKMVIVATSLVLFRLGLVHAKHGLLKLLLVLLLVRNLLIVHTI